MGTAIPFLRQSPLLQNSSVHIGFMPDAANINHQILNDYLQLQAQDMLSRTHFFEGRYENIYLQQERVPAVGLVLKQAEYLASNLLEIPVDKLRSGFWINDMGPQAITTEHDHDEYDELLSGVYYVQVPTDSGELIIVDKYSRTLIKPEAGMFVFFSPNVRHSVNMNHSSERRISIGMNFGPSSEQPIGN